MPLQRCGRLGAWSPGWKTCKATENREKNKNWQVTLNKKLLNTEMFEFIDWLQYMFDIACKVYELHLRTRS